MILNHGLAVGASHGVSNLKPGVSALVVRVGNMLGGVWVDGVVSVICRQIEHLFVGMGVRVEARAELLVDLDSANPTSLALLLAKRGTTISGGALVGGRGGGISARGRQKLSNSFV